MIVKYCFYFCLFFPLPFSHTILASISCCLLCYILFSIMEGLMLMALQLYYLSTENNSEKGEDVGKGDRWNLESILHFQYYWHISVKETQNTILHNIHWLLCYQISFVIKDKLSLQSNEMINSGKRIQDGMESYHLCYKTFTTSAQRCHPSHQFHLILCAFDWIYFAWLESLALYAKQRDNRLNSVVWT